MNTEEILSAPSLNLKPNGIFNPTSGKKPFLYQKRAGLLMIARSRMVLGDDVGLGKTLEAVLMMSYIKAAKPNTKFLIFTERNALLQWRDELADMVPSMKTKIITAESHPEIKNRVAAMRTHGKDVIISTYSMLYKYARYLKEGMQPRWVFIADEPDVFKNTMTAAHTNAFKMVNGAGGAIRAYGLTATIIGNRLSEAFGILRIIAPGTFASEEEFETKYCRIEGKGRSRRVIGYKNLDKFREQIEPVFFGRLQDHPEVMQDLPDIITKDVKITLSEKQSWKVVEAMDRIIETADGTIKQLDPLSAMTIAQILTDDPRVKNFDIQGSKIKALTETLTGSLRGERVVIYSKFRTIIDRIEEDLKQSKLKVIRITGLESAEEREHAKQVFTMPKSDPGHVPILLMTKAGSRAINLQAGGHLFFFDLPWAYDLYRQIIGRLKRTGSTHRKIGVYRYLGELHPRVSEHVGTSHTIDHYTLKIISKKFKLWQAITSDKEEISGVSENDVKDIYEEVVNSYKRPHEQST